MTTGTLRVIGAPRATVIVHRMPPPPDAVLRNIPAEAGVHTVVVAARPAPDVGTLASLLAGRLPVGCKVVRLVLSDGARNNLAGELADRLRLTVVAPDGPALLLESGTLFVPGGAWHEYRPSRRTGRLGARLPAPAWQAALDPLPKALGGLAYIEVPAGLWLRPVEFAGETLPVSALAVPVDPDRAAILVGHPDAPPAGPETMDALLGLPRGIRRRLTLIPYGRDSMRVHEMAERLAVHGADVEAANGVPGAATLDDDGSPGWQPSGEVFGYRAANAPVLRQPVKAGFWSIGDGWGVEIVRSGWLVRSLREDAETDAARRLLPHSAHPLVVLTSAVSEDAELADRLGRPGHRESQQRPGRERRPGRCCDSR